MSAGTTSVPRFGGETANAAIGAAICTAAALMIGVAASAGTPFLAAAVALVVIAVAAGWGEALQVPDARGTGLVVGVTGLAAVALALVNEGGDAPVAHFASVLALSVLLAFLHELVRRERSDVVESVSATLSGQLLVALAAGWVLLPSGGIGHASVLLAATALVAARLVMIPNLPAAGYVAIVAGGVAAGAASFWLPVEPLPAVLTGLTVAAGAAALERLLAPTAEDHVGPGLLAAAAAPLAASGAVAYAAVRLLLT